MKPSASLTVFPKPSRRLLASQSLAHLAAAAAVLAGNLPAWLVAVLLLLVGASLARVRRGPSATSMILGGNGKLEIVGADGTASEVAVHPHTLVLSFMIVLLYRQEGRLHSMTLLGDSLPQEDFRQLRLWLRWRSTAVNPA